ncbi:quinone oxidoreductase family protein [Paraburkholderia bannensis]|uniref:quinone oxidoreductase family protein n=1 Tax=Paraburkholderia bannensis TaxID=765414 RepID=UPI002ABD26EC|nr:zinc-binding alcohol dehydrogenase family protein [Paraburkholderia bannensis]
MKAAVITHKGAAPVYASFEEPAPVAGHTLVHVSASALSHVTRARASGTHYSSTGAFPFVAGVDGVGRRADGSPVYFFAPAAPFGGLAERTLVPDSHCVALPDALAPHLAAALAIPGMSSWAALMERARLSRGETVLINGATGASGRLAVQIAKHLGASKVIATGRHQPTLDALHALGADTVISLEQDGRALSDALEPHFRAGVDVVLDYLWGESARALLIGAAKGLPDAYPLRFVQIGSIAGSALELPSAVLRASAITLMGSGIGSVPLTRLLHSVEQVLQAAIPARLQIATHTAPLADIASQWGQVERRERVVLTM